MGRATAHLFATEGALVALTDINEADLARVVDEIGSEGADMRAGGSTFSTMTTSGAL
jgi:hypothetical protein